MDNWDYFSFESPGDSEAICLCISTCRVCHASFIHLGAEDIINLDTSASADKPSCSAHIRAV